MRAPFPLPALAAPPRPGRTAEEPAGLERLPRLSVVQHRMGGNSCATFCAGVYVQGNTHMLPSAYACVLLGCYHASGFLFIALGRSHAVLCCVLRILCVVLSKQTL